MSKADLSREGKEWYRLRAWQLYQQGWKLRQAKTLSKRAVIRLGEVIKVTHAGYRRPDRDCPWYQRT